MTRQEFLERAAQRRQRIQQLLARDWGIREIAQELGMTTQGVYEALRVIRKQEGAAA